MSLGKKIIWLLILLVVLLVVTVYTFDYKTILSNVSNDNKLVDTSPVTNYLDSFKKKAEDLKNDLLEKAGLSGDNMINSDNKPVDLELVKQDGMVVMNGTFKDESQAKEVADLLNINRDGEFSYEENRVKDVIVLNKLSSLVSSFKDFFVDGAKLSIEDGKVLLNGNLKDAKYKGLLDSIISKNNIEVISNINEPSISETQEIIETMKNKTSDIKLSKVSTDVQVDNNNENIVDSKKDVNNPINDVSSNLSQKSKQIQSTINNILEERKITFKRRSTSITKESNKVVEEIANILNENSNLKVEIAGHTDSRGRSSLNKRISQDRANSVKAVLVSLNVDANRLKAVGYGEDFPIAKDDADGLSEENRRVEFNITGE